MKMAKGAILGVAILVCCAAAVNAACNYYKMIDDLHAEKITQTEYVKRYTACITSGGSHPDQQTRDGFQPSCTTDKAVTQAIAVFNNRGQFKASDGKLHPFHVRGVVTFTQLDSIRTRIHATISGVSAFLSDSDKFSLHVHQKGEINPTCSSTGGHYNPCGKDHSNNPADKNRHIGDVAKVTIPAGQNVITITKIDTQVKLTGPLSVLGRSVTVHGGSGATRVGCGTIAVTEWEGDKHPDSAHNPSRPFWA